MHHVMEFVMVMQPQLVQEEQEFLPINGMLLVDWEQQLQQLDSYPVRG